MSTSPASPVKAGSGGMSLPVKNTLITFVRTHLRTAAVSGMRKWIGIRLDEEPTQEQIECLNRIGTVWSRKIAANCKIDVDLEALEKTLVADKEIAQDGTFNGLSLARRFAAYYATFDFLSVVTSIKGIPQPGNMEELLSVASNVCNAFYMVITDAGLSTIPGEIMTAAQSETLTQFIELE
jgi:hypothetical protein